MIRIAAVLDELMRPVTPLASTAIAQLDRATTGLMPGSLWVVTGRPRHGRTMFAMQLARRAAESGLPTHVLAGADSLTYYGALVVAAADELPLHDLLRGRSSDTRSARHPGRAADLAIELTTPRHTSLGRALESAPERCALVLDDADLWATSPREACEQVKAWLTPGRVAVATVPLTLIGPDRADWQRWVRIADVILDVEMGAGQALGDTYFTIVSNRWGPVTSVAARGCYHRARFEDFDDNRDQGSESGD